jgi:CRP-like cAMP-binding protein
LFCGISDIDISGTTVLTNLVSRAHRHGKKVLFCNVPAGRLGHWNLANGATPILSDRDTGLEWMEEQTLSAAAEAAAEALPPREPIPLSALDLMRGFAADEVAVLASLLAPHDFAPGAMICREGENADRMWVLTKVSVSVRLGLDGQQAPRRIASLAAGTTVGEMGLLDGGRRSATVMADVDVSTTS